MGRPGVDRVHRRQEHRRRARPQRPAAQPLRRHPGRPGGDGLRGRRARHPARGHRPEGPARTGQDVPGQPGGGADRRRRGAEARDRLGQALRQVAPRVHGAAGRGPRGAPGPRARPRHPAPPPAGVRLHAGGPQVHPRPDEQQRRGGARLDGDRHPAGRPLRPRPAAVQLLQATVRAGDQPAARRDPRGARHVGPDRRRRRGEPARPEAGELPADRARHPDPRQRRPGQAQAARIEALARVQVGRPADALPRRRGGRGAGAVARRDVRQGRRGDRGGRQPPDPLRPRRGRRERADPVAAGLRRAAPPPGPQGPADPRRAGHRVRRRARGPPLRAAARLRRRVDQPVRRVRDARRHDQPGDDQARDRPRRGGLPLPQGDQEGGGQGDVQDGHQHHPELPRCADLRGDRAEPGVRRPVLRQDRVADRRRRPGGDRRGRRSPTTAAPTPTARSARPCSKKGASTSGAATASTTCSTPRPSSSSSTPRRRAGTTSSRSTRASSTSRTSGSARSAASSSSRSTRSSRSRSRRSSRSSRSSSGSPPARCRTGRSAARRTRRWRSP